MSPIFLYTTAVFVAAAILYGAARTFARGARSEEDPAFGPPPPDVQVLSRTRVGIGRTLVIVEVEGRRLLLGSTKEQWSALADLGTAATREEETIYDGIDAELARVAHATRIPRGRRRS
ncbi:MAG: flagellar biosynthetic protein FliO [Hyphomicrobiales bacterium]